MTNWDNYHYYGDSRVREAMTTRAYTVEVKRGKTIVRLRDSIVENMIENEDLPEDHPGVFECPVKFVVCWACNGHGTTTDPNIDAGGITGDDERLDDPEFLEDYFGGAYDIDCPTCDGKRVTPQVTLPEFVQTAVESFEECEADDLRTMLHELRMGC